LDKPIKIKTVILARGGSKGIPQKNIALVNGNPLISYCIKASLDSNVDETWVSTDSDEIATVAKFYGANVVMRPNEISGDNAQSEDALLHFLNRMEEFDFLVFIQPTSPLLTPEVINKGISFILSGQYDSILSAYVKDWEAQFDQNMNPMNWDMNNRPRRQDIGDIIVENGALYITTVEQLKKSKRRYGGKMGYVEMGLLESVQIDKPNDIALVERIMKNDYIC
jgi:CMP-N,N'-diacetyllegionaminic acid synthase